MSLFIVQVLKIKMQTIDFLTRFGSLGFGIAGFEADVSVHSFQLGQSREEMSLLLV